MPSQMLRCADINLTPDPTRRDRSSKDTNKAIDAMAKSIDTYTMLQAIGVVPCEASPGRFDVVWGRQRFRATKDKLHREEIQCVILENADQLSLESLAIEENVRRDALTKQEYYASVARSAKIYADKYPGNVGKGCESARAAAAETRAAKAEGTTTDEVAGDIRPPRLDEEIAQLTGKSAPSARRDLHISRKLTPEQIGALEDTNVKQADLVSLARVKDEESRRKAVSLAASGLPVAEAIAAATGAPEPPKPVLAPFEVELTDAEFLDGPCGEFRKRLGTNTAAYDASALFYRATKDARQAFKTKIEKRLNEAVEKKPSGHFVRFTSQFLHVEHPRDWLICSRCSATGTEPNTLQIQGVLCKVCSGDGFRVKSGANG